MIYADILSCAGVDPLLHQADWRIRISAYEQCHMAKRTLPRVNLDRLYAGGNADWILQAHDPLLQAEIQQTLERKQQERASLSAARKLQAEDRAVKRQSLQEEEASLKVAKQLQAQEVSANGSMKQQDDDSLKVAQQLQAAEERAAVARKKKQEKDVRFLVSTCLT